MTGKDLIFLALLSLSMGYVWKLISLDHTFKWRQLLFLGAAAPAILLVEFLGFISPKFDVHIRLNLYVEEVTEKENKHEGDV